MVTSNEYGTSEHFRGLGRSLTKINKEKKRKMKKKNRK
jgi:hypothetical protein